ncbi:structural basis of promiscuous guanine nucleotide exchange By the T-cell essential Vav1, partial [Wilcoxina mikolae CBS 423.85]
MFGNETNIIYLKRPTFTEGFLRSVRSLQPLKLVIVGAGAVGKSSAIVCYTTNRFPQEYVPTVFENYVINCFLEAPSSTRCIELSIWDTAGQEEFGRLRPLCYDQTDVVMICFAIDSMDSFSNAQDIFLEEVKRFTSCPIVLVGLKSDLREERLKATDKKGYPVSYKQGLAMAKAIGAAAYTECSSLRGTGLQETFKVA